MLQRFLTHPLARGINLDSPDTTILRRRIIREKPFLERIYKEWYSKLLGAVPRGPGSTLELGSGAGFFKEYYPECVTSEVFFVPHVDLVCDGCNLPFPDSSLKCIVMTDVLHHIPRITDFLVEADRCISQGGVITMIEPWVTPWSRFVWGRLHHEPFLPETTDWHFQEKGPLSCANGALPWIVFSRDVVRLRNLLPNWRIDTLQPMMPFRYLLSGGVSLKCFVPHWSHDFWSWVESCLPSIMHHTAMFAHIVLRKGS